VLLPQPVSPESIIRFRVRFRVRARFRVKAKCLLRAQSLGFPGPISLWYPYRHGWVDLGVIGSIFNIQYSRFKIGRPRRDWIIPLNSLYFLR